jgi:hypothetical protein
MRVRGAMRRAGARARRGLALKLKESMGHRDFLHTRIEDVEAFSLN